MASPSTPATHPNVATRIGLTVGSGGAGWLVTLAVVHKPTMTVLAVVAVIVALAVNAVASICNALPEIIRAISDRETARISAAAEAKTMIMRARVRTDLARAAIEPGNLAPAAEMLRLLAIDPDMSPDGRRLPDDSLTKLLAAPRPKSSRAYTGGGPSKPGKDPEDPGKADDSNVFPLKPKGLARLEPRG